MLIFANKLYICREKGVTDGCNSRNILSKLLYPFNDGYYANVPLGTSLFTGGYVPPCAVKYKIPLPIIILSQI